jgi:hypothetical protein
MSDQVDIAVDLGAVPPPLQRSGATTKKNLTADEH